MLGNQPDFLTEGSEPLTGSPAKRRAILNAAADVFLRSGFLGASMDDIASLSDVSKQTVYKHFGSKEALFVQVVSAMTRSAASRVHTNPPEPETRDQLEEFLFEYGMRQLSVVLTPRLMQLRRLVIGEVPRFPDLAKALYKQGPQFAISVLASMFERLGKRGLLATDDPTTAASMFNWLLMGDPVNRAMLLGDSALPPDDELRRTAREAVRVFLAAYQEGDRLRA
jgi:TetR/AcrR family transcriptional regulator, mexJK operon transcriptional repressor